MTTTPTVIRASVADRIAALVPTTHAGDRFREHREEVELREWSDANPAGCLRRFSVQWVGAISTPLVSNTDLEEVEQEIEVRVAYPTTWRFGSGQRTKLHEVVADDVRRIAHTVGTNGAAGLASTTTSATIITRDDGENVERGDAVTFGVVRLRCVYTRSTT